MFLKRKRIILILLVVAVGVIGFKVVRQSSNTQVLGSDWETNRLIPVSVAQHNEWDWLLKKYVDDQGRVNYSAWQASSDDRRRLKDYLERLSRVDVAQTKDRASQMAFWINAHNALTIHGILDVYPTKSIRQLTNPVGFNIWTHLKLLVGGQAHSLSDIQRRLLRQFNDPRVHFAIVAAATSGSRLLNRAYTADQIEHQLELNTKYFFDQPRNFRIEGTKRVHLNSMLKWFARDFGDDSDEQRACLATYFNDPFTKHLIQSADTEISYIPYDWSLNEQK